MDFNKRTSYVAKSGWVKEINKGGEVPWVYQQWGAFVMSKETRRALEPSRVGAMEKGPPDRRRSCRGPSEVLEQGARKK